MQGKIAQPLKSTYNMGDAGRLKEGTLVRELEILRARLGDVVRDNDLLREVCGKQAPPVLDFPAELGHRSVPFSIQVGASHSVSSRCACVDLLQFAFPWSVLMQISLSFPLLIFAANISFQLTHIRMHSALLICRRFEATVPKLNFDEGFFLAPRCPSACIIHRQSSRLLIALTRQKDVITIVSLGRADIISDFLSLSFVMINSSLTFHTDTLPSSGLPIITHAHADD